mmetsp:Transcript_17215/g.24477  ORF Transcript_17215/g.24477 Transcript_17215/m.24477 type:complete len:180 (+) Transcript_17215:1830-2369(+)
MKFSSFLSDKGVSNHAVVLNYALDSFPSSPYVCVVLILTNRLSLHSLLSMSFCLVSLVCSCWLSPGCMCSGILGTIKLNTFHVLCHLFVYLVNVCPIYISSLLNITSNLFRFVEPHHLILWGEPQNQNGGDVNLFWGKSVNLGTDSVVGRNGKGFLSGTYEQATLLSLPRLVGTRLTRE